MLSDVVTVDDVMDDLKGYYTGTIREDEGSRIDSHSDNYVRWASGLYIMIGWSNHGKSEYLDHVMTALSMKHGHRWAIFSPENFPVVRHVKKIVSKYVGKPFSKDAPNGMSQAEAKHAIDWTREHFKWIYPSEGNLNLPYILDTIEKIHEKQPLAGYILDPWNTLEHNRPASKTETEYISESLGKITRFNGKHGFIGLVVVHPAKQPRMNDGRLPIPTLDMASGSIHFNNKADVGISFHRPDLTNNNATIFVQKMRWKERGQIGCYNIQYDKPSGRFKDEGAPTFDMPNQIQEAPFI